MRWDEKSGRVMFADRLKYNRSWKKVYNREKSTSTAETTAETEQKAWVFGAVV